MGVVYFFGGIAKLNADWLQGQPMRLWLPGSIRLPGLEPLLAHPASALLISWGGLLLDLLVVPALLWRRTRPYAFAAAIVFHLINSEMFDIGVFPWLAIWCTALFFDAGLAAPRLQLAESVSATRPRRPFAGTPGARATAALLVA